MEPDWGDITFTSAPACSRAFLGCRSSDSSTPSAAMAATLIPARFLSAIEFLLRVRCQFERRCLRGIHSGCCSSPRKAHLSMPQATGLLQLPRREFCRKSRWAAQPEELRRAWARRHSRLPADSRLLAVCLLHKRSKAHACHSCTAERG